jgi:hypothetical protein
MPNYTKKRNRSGRKGRGLSERVYQTMRRFLPWSSEPQYMPVEVPPMKTQKELREERISDLLERERHYPGTAPRNELSKWMPNLIRKTAERPFPSKYYRSTLPKKTIRKTTKRPFPSKYYRSTLPKKTIRKTTERPFPSKYYRSTLSKKTIRKTAPKLSNLRRSRRLRSSAS